MYLAVSLSATKPVTLPSSVKSPFNWSFQVELNAQFFSRLGQGLVHGGGAAWPDLAVAWINDVPGGVGFLEVAESPGELDPHAFQPVNS